MADLVRPTLYNFRRCPYAMRARIAVLVSEQIVELREVVLRDKPADMLAVSAKGTVPVLVLTDGTVIDESLDIMLWALKRSDPAGWLLPEHGVREDMLALIAACESDFKPHLDAYKYATKDSPEARLAAREKAGAFLDRLGGMMADKGYLFGARPALADVAIFPFVRQFAFVDRDWFHAAGRPEVVRWLHGFLEDRIFLDVMVKFAKWEPGQEPVLFGGAV